MQGEWFSASVEAKFDGEYIGQLERTEECGAVTKFKKVVINRMNKWVLEPNEKLVAWQEIPEFIYDTHAPSGCPL